MSEDAGERYFHYSQGIAPMMWVLIVLSVIELVVVHMLVAFWNVWVALILSLLTLAGIVWMVRLIRSFHRLPVVVDAEGVLLRTGRLQEVRIPAGAIGGVQTSFASEALKRKGVLNLALIAYPNVIVALREPMDIGRRKPRQVVAVAHRLDDPAGFAKAVAELGGAP